MSGRQAPVEPTRFFFFVRPQGPPGDAGYQHCAIALAEGLRALGIAYHSNANYWPIGDEWLFNHHPDIRPQDCGVVVTGDEARDFANLPDDLFRGGRKIVYVDSSDGWRTRAEGQPFRRFDLVLRTHFNDHYRYPANVVSWAFGLTNRIIRYCREPLPFLQRDQAVLSNFRVSHPVRRVAQQRVLKTISRRFRVDASQDSPPQDGAGQDRLYWEATGRRHYPAFFDRLKKTMICAAFGGYFAPGRFARTENILERVLYRAVSSMGSVTRTVMQFDSWRFWESLAAGCLTLQVDYARYGCRLPVQPVSGTHFAGVDFGSRDSLEWLLHTDLQELAAVADAGRRWALEHYSPRATALRLMGLLGIRL